MEQPVAKKHKSVLSPAYQTKRDPQEDAYRQNMSFDRRTNAGRGSLIFSC